MKQDNPLIFAGVMAAIVVVFLLWLQDFRRAKSGQRDSRAFPGATPAPFVATAIGVAGVLALLALEVVGEYRLGIVHEQTTITWLFAFYLLGAGFAEELIFRGYFVVTGRGRGALVASAIGFSMIFALMHPFLVGWDGGFELSWDRKSVFSTSMIFLGSLWFYWLRFQPLNPTRSLVPCIAAHVTKNAGVIAVKAAQGFVVGLW